MADQRDLEFVEGNDPLVTFNLRRELATLDADGNPQYEPVDVSDRLVEVYVKVNRNLADGDETTVRYHSDAGGGIGKVDGPGGVVNVQFRGADLGGSMKRYYRIDTVDVLERRLTYAYGQISKVNV